MLWYISIFLGADVSALFVLLSLMSHSHIVYICKIIFEQINDDDDDDDGDRRMINPQDIMVVRLHSKNRC